MPKQPFFPQPLPATKKSPGGYLTMRSQDRSAWVVCGYNCAVRVPIDIDQNHVVDYALARPELWTH